MCAPRRFGPKNVPLIARLFASLPPPVNTISSGAAPRSAATWLRARSSPAFAGALAQMAAGGVAESVVQKGPHRLRHGRVNRRARVAIEIDLPHRRRHLSSCVWLSRSHGSCSLAKKCLLGCSSDARSKAPTW